MLKNIYVAAAIIRHNDHIFCAQRHMNTSLPGLWEFPGGKIQDGESLSEAVIREVREELAIEVVAENTTYTDTIYEYDFGKVHLKTILCDLLDPAKKITLNEHIDSRWLKSSDLLSLDWAPADLPAVNCLMKEDGLL